MRSSVVFSPMMRMLLPSKLVAFWRLRTSSMRGCCHCPGVDGVTAGEGCCCCCFCSVPAFCGVRLSFGRTEVTADGEDEEVDCWRESAAGVSLL